MLLLTRKRNETVLIGDDVEVTVVEITKSWVRLGVTAPDSVHIDRAELRETIERDGRRPRLRPYQVNAIQTMEVEDGTVTIPIGTGKSPRCAACDGTGWFPYDAGLDNCKSCGGTGFLT